MGNKRHVLNHSFIHFLFDKINENITIVTTNTQIANMEIKKRSSTFPINFQSVSFVFSGETLTLRQPAIYFSTNHLMFEGTGRDV